MEKKTRKKSRPALLAIITAFLLIMAAITSCSRQQNSTDEALIPTDEVMANCLERMREITSVKIISEQWFRSENDTGIQKRSEGYRIFPDSSHTIYEVTEPIYPDDIVEEWRFGKERYLRYGDGRIETSISEDHDFLPELALFEMAKEAEFERKEMVGDSSCFVICAKLPHDMEDIYNGYILANFYIDDRDYLLKRLIIEDYPIRYFNKSYDDSYVVFYDILYSDYDQGFQIRPPDI